MIKDLVYKIAVLLEDRDVKNLSLINKHYYTNIFNEDFWKKRLYTKFNDILPEKVNIYNESWKKYYFLVDKWVNEIDLIKSVKFVISEDRSDLLRMIYTRWKQIYNANIYDWNRKNNDKFLNPYLYAIRKDSINCFNTFISENGNFEPPFYLELNEALFHDSHKIIKHLSKYIKSLHIITIFNNNCETCGKIAENIFEKYTGEIIYLLTMLSYKNVVEKLLKGDNKPFSMFVNKIPYKKLLEYKNKALERNKPEVSKCLTIYTSILN